MTASINGLAVSDFSTLTIATGVVTATQTMHTIAAETGAADDLVTITAGHTNLDSSGVTFRPILILKADTGDTITIKHGTGNIELASGGDFTLSGNIWIQLSYDGSNWHDLSSSVSTFSFAADEYTVNEASDYTTTSTSFTDVDATNLSLTITTTGGDVIVGWVGAVSNTNLTNNYFNIDIDGSSQFADDGLLQVTEAVANFVCNASFTVIIAGLSAASHTFKLQWKVQAGTGKIPSGAGTSSIDTHPVFWVRELP